MRHSSTKPVGVYVEQCKINEQTKLLWQVPSNVAMVKINPRHCSDLGVVKCASTVNPSVVTNFRSNPIPSEIERIREYSLLPCLQCYISIFDSIVFENQRWVYGDIFTSVTELVPVVKKLPLPYVQGFSVGEASMGVDLNLFRGTD